MENPMANSPTPTHPRNRNHQPIHHRGDLEQLLPTPHHDQRLHLVTPNHRTKPMERPSQHRRRPSHPKPRHHRQPTNHHPPNHRLPHPPKNTGKKASPPEPSNNNTHHKTHHTQTPEHTPDIKPDTTRLPKEKGAKSPEILADMPCEALLACFLEDMPFRTFGYAGAGGKTRRCKNRYSGK